MSQYKIKYIYDTGDSFKNEYGCEGILEVSWKNLEVAKANLKRIQEHYEQYKGLNNRYGRDAEPNAVILERNKLKDWFVKQDRLVTFIKENPERYHAIDKGDEKRWLDAGNEVKTIIDVHTAENQIILYTDDGKPWQFFAPWCGYFETLQSAEIIADDTDMKISF